MSELRRRLLYAKPKEDYSMYAVHKKVNPEVMAICYAQGWAANENYLTFEEAAAVTSIGTAFAVNTVTSFDEFQYFTGVTAIPNSAFNHRYSTLGSITLPPNVTSIGSLAFRYCIFTQFTITSSIVSINENSLQDCPNLTKIIFDNNNVSVANVNWLINTPCDTIEIGPNCTNFNVYDNCIYSLDYKTLYRCATYRSSITFHPNITTFANDALSRVQLTTLTIPNAVTTLPAGFANFSLLQNINLNNVTNINNRSIFGSGKLESIDLSNIIGYLGIFSFRYCPLTLIKIGSGVTNLQSAFLDCNKISTIICYATTPPNTTNQSFPGAINNAAANNLHVYVPDASVNTYKATGYWAQIADYIHPLSEYAQS